MAEETKHVPWKTARKRSRQTKERVAMRNFGQILIRNQLKLQEELDQLRSSGPEAGSVKELSLWLQSCSILPQPPQVSLIKKVSQDLEKVLAFKRLREDEKDPLAQLPIAEGMQISKKIAFFLRHNMPEGKYSRQDGSVPISALEVSLGVPIEKILRAVSPEYDTEKKRRFVVLEYLHPNTTVTVRVAALGGHSIKILAPPGHFLLGKEAFQQLCPLLHNTSAVNNIKKDGFISQQGRKGGINFCPKENKYRLGSTHSVILDEESSLALDGLGYQFFGNRFCDVVYGVGKWEGDTWSGQIPAKFLKFTLKRL